ncbi:MAG: pyruvate kinase [Planctomycetes bacterium]|nr:pyruvate kinase [Planctomycetota bacterium]
MLKQPRTKIVATIGPVSCEPATLRALLEAGVNVARLNFSHGTHESHGKTIDAIRSVADNLGLTVAILQDLQGPKIRTGRLVDGGPVALRDGATVTITSRDVEGTAERISTSYESLADDVAKGDRILLSDGLIELRVLSAASDEVACKVINGGALREHAGMNLPEVNVNIPAFTEKDREDLAFGIEQGVDWVAMSFVRTARDVQDVAEAIARADAQIPVIAKIEKPEAVKELRSILSAVDGVMVARGDLAVETSPADVPVYQKRIIAMARRMGKISITATQMLESMVHEPRPTRAEASDVANAVYDGTDAVMLSAETSIGKYPVEAVEMMAEIARTVDEDLAKKNRFLENKNVQGRAHTAATVSAAYIAAMELGAKAIIAFTESGSTARLLARHRPNATIVAYTPSAKVARRLALLWGTRPYVIGHEATTDDLIAAADERLVKDGLVKKGDTVVMVAGTTSYRGATNTMKVHCVGGTKEE